MWNTISYVVIGVFWSYYYIMASLLRRFAPNPFLLFTLYFFNFIFGFIIFLEGLYFSSSFVARLIMFFYTPAGLLTVYLVLTLLLPLYVLKLVYPASWEETWEELWHPIVMIILILPYAYMNTMGDAEPDAWDADNDSPAIYQYEILSKLLNDAFVFIS